MPNELDDPRTWFAAERTFLAWIRTGLGLTAVGFALARFGLFLREFASQQHVPTHSTGLSVDSGVALVILGVLVNVAAVISHLRTAKELRSGTWIPGRMSRPAVLLAMVLAFFGIGVAVWLLLLRS
jgi:putative membrane protein